MVPFIPIKKKSSCSSKTNCLCFIFHKGDVASKRMCILCTDPSCQDLFILTIHWSSCDEAVLVDQWKAWKLVLAARIRTWNIHFLRGHISFEHLLTVRTFIYIYVYMTPRFSRGTMFILLYRVCLQVAGARKYVKLKLDGAVTGWNRLIPSLAKITSSLTVLAWGFVWDWVKEGMSLKDNSVSPCSIVHSNNPHPWTVSKEDIR